MHLPEGYILDGKRHNWLLYFLVDGIYPKWAIFVGPCHSPASEQEAYMTKRQEAVRKAVERFFGCLQGRFRILRGEGFEWKLEDLILISEVCVILHNMLDSLRKEKELEDEMDENGNILKELALLEEFMDTSSFHEIGAERNDILESEFVGVTGAASLALLLERCDAIKSEYAHVRLRTALIGHLWAVRGLSPSSAI